MNIVLWVVQGLLAFLYFSGGIYKCVTSTELSNLFAPISRLGWQAVGVLEVVGAIFLIVPSALNWAPSLTPLIAALLAVETFVIAAVYGWRSLKLTVENPMVWAVAMGCMALIVAGGRYLRLSA